MILLVANRYRYEYCRPYNHLVSQHILKGISQFGIGLGPEYLSMNMRHTSYILWHFRVSVEVGLYI
jgi:hypothetical protein